MLRMQVFRVLISERLTAAAEEIFGVFERTMIQYEGEIDRQRKMLDVVMKIPTDHLQLPVCEEAVPPEQQERSPGLGQEEPEPLHIKEEELFLQMETADDLKLTVVLDKCVSDKEKKSQPSEHSQTPETVPLASTSTEQMKTEPDGEEDCGISELVSNLNPAVGLEPAGDGQLLSSDWSDTETEDKDDYWRETREPQSDLNPLNTADPEEGQSWSIGNNFHRYTELPCELESSNNVPLALCCKVCRESFPSKRSLVRHVRVHSSSCGLCGKQLEPTENLEIHLSAHRKCSVCCKRFASFTDLERHMSTHTGQRPFICSVCGRTFGWKENLKVHMRTHTGERPFRCPLCGKGFGQKGNMNKHMVSHTGERPFGCSLCGKGFTEKGNLQKHMRIHTGEKPYGCSTCGKRFNQMPHLKKHKCRTESTGAAAAAGAAEVRGHSYSLW